MAARAADLSSVQGVSGCGRVDEGLCDRDRAAGVLGDRGYSIAQVPIALHCLPQVRPIYTYTVAPD